MAKARKKKISAISGGISKVVFEFFGIRKDNTIIDKDTTFCNVCAYGADENLKKFVWARNAGNFEDVRLIHP